MLNIILPSDQQSLFENLREDPDTILDVAAMLNCLGTCSLCDRRFVPSEPFVASLSGIYGDPAGLHEELRYNPYISHSQSLCGFCHSNPGFLNMFQKMKKL